MLNDKSDNDGSDSRFSGTYYFHASSFNFDESVGSVRGLGFVISYQHESSPNVIYFCVFHVCNNRSQIQRWSTHKNVSAPKLILLFTNLKPIFIVIVMF